MENSQWVNMPVASLSDVSLWCLKVRTALFGHNAKQIYNKEHDMKRTKCLNVAIVVQISIKKYSLI